MNNHDYGDKGGGGWHRDGQYLGPIAAAVYLLRRFIESGLLPQVRHHEWDSVFERRALDELYERAFRGGNTVEGRKQ